MVQWGSSSIAQPWYFFSFSFFFYWLARPCTYLIPVFNVYININITTKSYSHSSAYSSFFPLNVQPSNVLEISLNNGWFEKIEEDFGSIQIFGRTCTMFGLHDPRSRITGILVFPGTMIPPKLSKLQHQLNQKTITISNHKKFPKHQHWQDLLYQLLFFLSYSFFFFFCPLTFSFLSFFFFVDLGAMVKLLQQNLEVIGSSCGNNLSVWRGKVAYILPSLDSAIAEASYIGGYS